MTHPPEDQPALWLKQIPLGSPRAQGTWSQALLPGHRAVARSRERPTETVDAVTHCELLAAVDEVLMRHNDRHDPALKRLHDARLGLEKW